MVYVHAGLHLGVHMRPPVKVTQMLFSAYNTLMTFMGQGDQCGAMRQAPQVWHHGTCKDTGLKTHPSAYSKALDLGKQHVLRKATHG